MAKELVLHEEICKSLQILDLFNEPTLTDVCEKSLKKIATNEPWPQKKLSKASEKLGIPLVELENCFNALAMLWLEMTKQLRQTSKLTLSCLELLGIPKDEFLAQFWSQKAYLQIGTTFLPSS